MLLISLLLTHLANLNGMTPQRDPQEWDAQLYHNGSYIYKEAVEFFFQTCPFDLSGKVILDVGCGPGDNSKLLFDMGASYLLGIDASKNMIDFAKSQYTSSDNFSFEYSFLEDFHTDQKFDLITLFFCLSFIQDKRAAFKHLYSLLDDKGHIYFTINTTGDGEPIAMTTLLETIPFLKAFLSFIPLLGINAIEQAQECAFGTNRELFKNMLEEVGFKIVYMESLQKDYVINDLETLRTLANSLIFCAPMTQKIPNWLKNMGFERFMKLLVPKLEMNNHDQFIYPGIRTTLCCIKKA